MAKKEPVKIELTKESVEFIRRFSDYPEVLSDGIRDGMDRANLVSLSRIQRSRFSGTGPFKPSQHRLGIVSGRLRRSLRTVPAEVENASNLEVRSGMGSAVEYFGAHEFGLRKRVTVRSHLRNGSRVRSHTRAMNVPERAPLRTGLRDDDVQEIYQEEIERGIRRSVENLT